MFDLNHLDETRKKIDINNREVSRRVIVKKIPLSDIKVNEDNFYSINHIELLAEDIKLNGLQNPIKLSNDNIILSGHRRYNALKLLNSKYGEYEHVEVIYVDDFKNDDEKQLFLMRENLTRVKTKEDLETEYTITKAIYRKLKASGEPKYQNINVNKLVAEEFGVSESTIKRATRKSERKPDSANEILLKKINSLNKYINKHKHEINVDSIEETMPAIDQLIKNVTGIISIEE